VLSFVGSQIVAREASRRIGPDPDWILSAVSSVRGWSGNRVWQGVILVPAERSHSSPVPPVPQ